MDDQELQYFYWVRSKNIVSSKTGIYQIFFGHYTSVADQNVDIKFFLPKRIWIDFPFNAFNGINIDNEGVISNAYDIKLNINEI